MKTIAILATLAALNLEAQNLRWTSDYIAGDYFGNIGDGTDGLISNGDTTPVGALTVLLYEGAVQAQISLSLEPTYSVQFMPAWWINDPSQIYTVTQEMVVGVAYDTDPGLVIPGASVWIKPFWFDSENAVNQRYFVSKWSEPIEFTDQNPPSDGDDDEVIPDPPGDGGGGAIPETSNYALLAALGLLGFSAWRRYAR